MHPMRLAAVLTLLAASSPAGAEGLIPPLTADQAGEAARIVASFRTNPRGPFFRIRWFCADGTDHPPSPYPCGERGGGVQHATLSAEALKLAEWNVDVGTIYAGITYEEFVDAPRDHHRLKQLVLERYLEQIDSGWIYRRGYSYRGARQAEDEEKYGRRYLTKLLSDPEWLRGRSFLANQLVDVVPHGAPDSSVRRIRTLAQTIADADSRFQPLRAKIHSTPDAQRDLAAVERFGKEAKPSAAVQAELDELAGLLRTQNAGQTLDGALARLRKAKLDGPLLEAADALGTALKGNDASKAWAAGGQMSALIAKETSHSTDGARNLSLLDFQVALLDFGFQAAPPPEGRTRRQLAEDLGVALDYAFGAGLLSGRQRDALERERTGLLTDEEIESGRYFEITRYLARAPEWARATAAKEFGPAVELYSAFEPKAHGLIDELLRGSPALVVSGRLETLVTDAGRAVGVRHSILGSESGGGIVGLNPGSARGVLAILADHDAPIDSTRIYVVPQTASELKPMAGVLTLDSGNALSHTQLLAANLGVPNASIPSSLLPRLEPYYGREIEFLVGPRGEVTLREAPAAETPLVRAAPRAKLRLDVSGIDLSYRKLTPLADLQARKPGEICGPKAFNLGRLAAMFPEDVAPGVVVPFGVFLAHVERPLGGDAVPLTTRIQEAVQQVDAMRGRGASANEIEQYLYPQLAKFRELIRTMPLTAEFDRDLRTTLDSRFGKPGEFGVFVRSDTNAEDLPEFTGAGLNLTVPNVVGTEKIIQAIKDVWASPFTERAYEWRSRILESQGRVYPSVLLQRTVRSDKSGVIATIDLETGDRTAITVNVNEGVSAVVDGGVAESLLLTADGGVKLLQQARAAYRKVADPNGGFQLLPSSGSNTVLQPDEIRQVRELVARVEERYPPAYGPDETRLPWDIEFGFEGGQRRLFQIRPLARFEAPQAIESHDSVRLDEVPE